MAADGEPIEIVLAVARPQMLGDAAAAVDFAKTRPNVRKDRVGVTGWCWGGSTTMQIAAANPDVAKDIKIPFLGLFGETDQNLKA